MFEIKKKSLTKKPLFKEIRLIFNRRKFVSRVEFLFIRGYFYKPIRESINRSTPYLIFEFKLF